jgi:CRISPR-associated protein Cas2
MAINAPRNHLVCYDIADPERLTKVHRTVKRWGMPLQYSVFLVSAAPRAIADLIRELGRLIDHRKDDIRIYPLPTRLDMTLLGRQGLPEGIVLTNASEVGRVFELLVTGVKPQ